MEVKGNEDVAGCHVQAAPAVAKRWAVEGQGCVARGHGDGPCVVRWICRGMPSQVVPESVGEWPEEAWQAGRGGAAGVACCAR